MKISIIIPVFNEAFHIAKILDYLIQVKNQEFTHEIIVVDGGSTDATLEILKKYPSIKVINSQKGRAIQMNYGAKYASSQILYFLHCDTFPPQNFDFEIVNHVKKGSLSGCFKMKFDSNHIVLKLSQWFTQFNFKYCRGGDQSLFVEKNLFEKLNGFNEGLNIYEDNELIFRLYKASKFVVIQQFVTTSSRKYKANGIWKLQFHFFVIHLMCFLNFFNQNQVESYYQRNVKS
jgi:rSAM/selenodomain-associated transferase 2